ncbi:phosphoribosylamine--glycine ligase [Sphingomonas sp. PB2P19]|uniref:phosphoribosylamine--glycine ligase n=1 Tax=Sphingomonas rhamnosi TaxID=3096156 RepID=UPI002FCB75B1
MNVLLLGSGGREHALAWKLVQSSGLDTLYAAPGNPGIATLATCVALDATDHAAVVQFAHDHAIGLVVIGPEAPLVDGLADTLIAADIPVFGPTRAAAQLEGSKGFTKELCTRAGIPTAGYARVRSRVEAETTIANVFALPVVIKADGLAAGKGVVIALSQAEVTAALDALYGDDPAADVVIEEFLDGEEASLFVLTDGKTIMPFGSAQDHKRVGDGDTGPNTGGMGAYSPARVLTPELEARAIAEIIAPTVKTMADEGMQFSGVLYAGLMLTRNGPKLIEYNARFGDPEAQVLMLRFKGDLLATMLAVAEGRLATMPPAAFSDETALTVVMAANGYPGTPQAGGSIAGIDAARAAGGTVFQAGTRYVDGGLVAAGGRVLAVSATGDDVREAQAAAYRAVSAIDFPTGFYRRDIGWREVARAD